MYKKTGFVIGIILMICAFFVGIQTSRYVSGEKVTKEEGGNMVILDPVTEEMIRKNRG